MQPVILILSMSCLQVIAVKGVNPSGSRILAKHIWTHIPPHSSHKAGQTAAADTTAADAMDVDDMGVGGSDVCSSGLSVVVAAGPFCLADDLAYDPLHELLQDLKSSPPNMLVSCAAESGASHAHAGPEWAENCLL